MMWVSVPSTPRSEPGGRGLFPHHALFGDLLAQPKASGFRGVQSVMSEGFHLASFSLTVVSSGSGP